MIGPRAGVRSVIKYNKHPLPRASYRVQGAGRRKIAGTTTAPPTERVKGQTGRSAKIKGQGVGGKSELQELRHFKSQRIRDGGRSPIYIGRGGGLYFFVPAAAGPRTPRYAACVLTCAYHKGGARISADAKANVFNRRRKKWKKKKKLKISEDFFPFPFFFFSPFHSSSSKSPSLP